MVLLAQTPNVKITGNYLECGVYQFALSSKTGTFIPISPETLNIFLKVVRQFPNVKNVYRHISQWGGSYITIQYRKDNQELCVTYKNYKSKLKESPIIISNDDMRIFKSELPATHHISFIKDIMMDDSFHESEKNEESRDF
jgi:hypothetical protein